MGQTVLAFDSLTQSIPEDSWFSVNDLSGSQDFTIVGQLHLCLTVSPSNQADHTDGYVYSDARPPSISAPPPPLPTAPKPALELPTAPKPAPELPKAPKPHSKEEPSSESQPVRHVFPSTLPSYPWDLKPKPALTAKHAPPARPAKPELPAKPERPEKPMKPAKPLPPRPERPAKPAKPEKPELPAKPERHVKAFMPVLPALPTLEGHRTQRHEAQPPKPANPAKPLPSLPPKPAKPLPSLPPTHTALTAPPTVDHEENSADVPVEPAAPPTVDHEENSADVPVEPAAPSVLVEAPPAPVEDSVEDPAAFSAEASVEENPAVLPSVEENPVVLPSVEENPAVLPSVEENPVVEDTPLDVPAVAQLAEEPLDEKPTRPEDFANLSNEVQVEEKEAEAALLAPPASE